MKDKIPTKNIIIETKDFVIVRIKQADTYKLKKNELIILENKVAKYAHKLIWFNEDEEMVFYRLKQLTVPRCYYEYRLDWIMAFEYYKRWRETKVINEDKKREQIEQLKEKYPHIKGYEEIIWWHIQNKNCIRQELMKSEDVNSALDRLTKEYSKTEVLEAIEEIPWFPEGIIQPEEGWKAGSIDTITQLLIQAQVEDNKNLKNGIVTYNCLIVYKIQRNWIGELHGKKEWEFIIKQYESKMKNRGFINALLDERYQEVSRYQEHF